MGETEKDGLSPVNGESSHVHVAARNIDQPPFDHSCFPTESYRTILLCVGN